MLRWFSTIGLLCSLLLLPGGAGAALSEDDFYIRQAQDLVDLCSAPESDPLRTAAVHFCHGFASGAWQYHQAQAAGPEGHRLVCPPDPPPTRTEAIAGFLAWSASHPQHMAGPAVEALFRYLVETWPCPKAGGEGSK